MRRNLVAGNWKMNGDQAMAAALCADILRGLDRAFDTGRAAAETAAAETAAAGSGHAATEIALCPPHILIPAAAGALAGSSISVGAQDLDANDNGPFTGQISARMLIDSGCRYVIVGHSERRTLYHETDELAAQKANAALAAGLSAIVCLGETRAQRQAGITEEVVGRQLDAVLDVIGVAGIRQSALAYEPVWAIGTGLSATPAEAQQVHRFIREQLAARDARAAATCRILYGGSMKPANAAQLIAQPDIDGGLIGGAALNAADFVAICKAAATSRPIKLT